MSIDVRLGDGREELHGDARLVGHMTNRDFGLVLIEGDGGHNHIFHAGILLAN
jgi:hypothetical protein